MGKNCGLIRERISAFVHSELSPGEGRIVEDHLAGCPDCRLIRDQVLAVTAGIAAVREAGVVESDFLRRRLKAAVRDLPRAEPFARGRWAIGLAAAVFLAVVSWSLYFGLTSRERAVDLSLVDRDLVVSFVQDYRDSVYSFEYHPTVQSEFLMFQDFYEYATERAGIEDSKTLNANYRYLIRNLESFDI